MFPGQQFGICLIGVRSLLCPLWRPYARDWASPWKNCFWEKTQRSLRRSTWTCLPTGTNSARLTKNCIWICFALSTRKKNSKTANGFSCTKKARGRQKPSPPRELFQLQKFTHQLRLHIPQAIELLSRLSSFVLMICLTMMRQG